MLTVRAGDLLELGYSCPQLETLPIDDFLAILGKSALRRESL